MREFKIVVLGAGGVGKSALTVRFVRDNFIENYNPTIEEQYKRPFDSHGERFMLDILDTAGAEQFTALNEVYISSGHGFLLVFSLTHEASLREVDDIRQQIYRIKGGTDVPIVVVGTKMDLASEREVTRDSIRDLATRWSLPFYETSAKKNWHIGEVFENLIDQMRQRYPQDLATKKKRKKKKHLGDTCVIM